VFVCCHGAINSGVIVSLRNTQQLEVMRQCTDGQGKQKEIHLKKIPSQRCAAVSKDEIRNTSISFISFQGFIAMGQATGEQISEGYLA